jgi:NADPH:quinone reductase
LVREDGCSAGGVRGGGDAGGGARPWRGPRCAIKALTDGDGVERIVEVDVSGNASLYPAIMARDGLIAAYGTNSQEIKLLFSPLILTGAAIRFFIVYELAPKTRREAIEQLAFWINRGLLRHTVAARYPLERIVDAHEAVERGTHIGNVVVTL